MGIIKVRTINPISLILLKILGMGLLGIPFAFLVDKNGYFFYSMRNLSDKTFILSSYLLTLYAFLVMIFLYYILGLKKRINNYMKEDIVHLSSMNYKILWMITFALSFICFLIIFIQAGGKHPALTALSSDYLGIQELRHNVSLAVNLNVYNIGFKFFLPFNIIISLFLLRKLFMSLASLFLFLLMSPFVLEKGQIVSFIVLVIFVRILISKISYKKIFQYGVLSLLLISAMYIITRFATGFASLASSISKRLFYGQISDLPYYFELFSKGKISFGTLLPPYIANLLGLHDMKSASYLAMAHINPEAFSQGTVGVANSFYIGEAFAVAGYLGVILSPFIVMANLAFFVYFFTKLKKNIFFLFLFAWFLFKTFDGIFGGISYFTFSGLHILLLCIIYYLYTCAFVKQTKLIGKIRKED